jgi:hypothetical protein
MSYLDSLELIWAAHRIYTQSHDLPFTFSMGIALFTAKTSSTVYIPRTRPEIVTSISRTAAYCWDSQAIRSKSPYF